MLGLVMPKVSWMNSRWEREPGAAAHLDPGLRVELERVDKNTVVVEDGEINVVVGGHVVVLFEGQGSKRELRVELRRAR